MVPWPHVLPYQHNATGACIVGWFGCHQCSQKILQGQEVIGAYVVKVNLFNEELLIVIYCGLLVGFSS